MKLYQKRKDYVTVVAYLVLAALILPFLILADLIEALCRELKEWFDEIVPAFKAEYRLRMNEHCYRRSLRQAKRNNPSL